MKEHLWQNTMNFKEEYAPFTRDLRKLANKYRTLPDDFLKLKEFIDYRLKQPLVAKDKHTTILHEEDEICIVKTRMASFSVKKSPFRVVYAYFQEEELADFIQIYFKGDRKREDTERWKQYIDELRSLC